MAFDKTISGQHGKEAQDDGEGLFGLITLGRDKLLEFILDSFDLCVLVLCPDGKILFASKSAASSLGYKKSQLLGASLCHFVPGLEENWPQSISAPESADPDRRWQIRDPLGNRKYVQWRMQPFQTTYGSFTLLVLSDCDSKKALSGDRDEAAAQISSANERLCASNRQLEKSVELAEKLTRDVRVRSSDTSERSSWSDLEDEIRTSVNVIAGMLSLLRDTFVDEEQADYIVTAESAVGHLMSLLGDGADLSKTDIECSAAARRLFDLSDEVDLALDRYAIRAQEKNVELTCAIEKDVPLTLIGCPRVFRRLLENFLENAVSVTDRGEINIEISLDRRTDGTAEIRFLTADTGPGLSPEAIAVLTGPFDGVTEKTKIPSAGFEIILARRLSEIMGVELFAQNSDRGAAVWFSLPFEVGRLSFSELSDKKKLPGCEVIVADDNMSARRATALCAAELGCLVMEISTATDLAARIHLSKTRFLQKVTVLVDVDMPAAARALKPNGELPPFVNLIGLVPRMGFQEGRGFFREDFSAFLTKPVKCSRLIRTLIRTACFRTDVLTS